MRVCVHYHPGCEGGRGCGYFWRLQEGQGWAGERRQLAGRSEAMSRRGGDEMAPAKDGEPTHTHRSAKAAGGGAR